MSTQSAANGSNLRRTTNWNVADPITTISLWWFFNSLAALRTIWDAGDNTSFRPQLYYDNGSNKVFLANAILEPSFEVIDAPSINTAYYAAVVLNLGSPTKIYRGVAGAALTTLTTAENFDGFTGASLTFFDELANDQTLNGKIMYAKVWSGASAELSADQVQWEYLRGCMAYTGSVYSNNPMTNQTDSQVDISGNGNNYTKNGTLTTQRTNPPVPFRGALDLQVC